MVGTTGKPGATDRPPLSLRAYAKLRGVSPESVSQAIKRGRLQASVTRQGGVPKIADRELADREWAANTDLSRAPDAVKSRAAVEMTSSSASLPSGAVLLARASAQEKVYRAKLAEQKYRERAGELVEWRPLLAEWVEQIVICRSKLLGIPSQAKQRLPHLALEDVTLLDTLVREAVEALALPVGVQAVERETTHVGVV